ncbi:MAG: Na+/H+ antiporter subunit E [Anaerosomatales bacterium]|nr:Na+/H+ antiporter subunit E [Anaerosomatales bacterium]
MRLAEATIALYVFWLVLTGSFAPIDLLVGLLLSAALGVWATRTLWAEDAPTLSLRQAGRLFVYVLWLIKEIVVAAVYVAEKVLDPRMPIEPLVLSHRCSFTRDVSRVAFANSITLTPGTLTVDVADDVFTIHCLAETFADSIASGALERRIAAVFEE